MTKFRMYCGLRTPFGVDVTPAQFEAFLAKHVARQLSGFTVYGAEGYWQGAEEQTRIIEYIGRHEERARVDAIAQQYAECFAQDSVLVTQEQISSELVRAPLHVAQANVIGGQF